MAIIRAGMEQLHQVARLFNAYRHFYGKDLDLQVATEFIANRMRNEESAIFLAVDDNNQELGFVQLYPSFSSVALKTIWYLNDLFVSETARNCGIASALLEAAQQLAFETEALTIKLATGIENEPAKALYLKAGFTEVKLFDHFTRRV